MKLNSAEISKETETEVAGSKLKTAVFNTLYFLNGSKVRKVKWRHVLIEAVIEEAQLLSLFYIEGSILDSQAYTSAAMKGLSMARLDFLFIYLGLYVFLLYFLLSMSLVAILALGYPLYLAYKSKPITLKSWHELVLKVLIPAMSVTMRIPITCVTILTMKYNTEDFSPEYGVSLEGYNVFFKAIALFVWIVHVIVSLVYEVSSIEIRHHVHSKNLRAKSSQQPENWRICSIYSMCALHFAFDDNSSIVIYTLIILIFIVPFCRFLYAMPYYTMKVNFLYICCSFLMMLGAFSHMLAVWFEDANYFIAIFVFLSPPACVLLHHLLHYMKKRLNLPQNISPNNYEFHLRNYFTYGEIEPTLKARLKQANSFDTFYYIWKAYYCIGKQKRLVKARRIMHNMSVYKTSWTTEYQVMRCQAMIEEESCEENYKFIEVFNKINEVFKKDVSLSFCTLEIWKELLSKNPRENKLRELVGRHIKLTATCKDQYRNLLKAFPNNIDLMFYYGTFLCETCCETKDGDHYISKALNIADAEARSHSMSPFALGNSVILLKMESNGELVILNTNFKARNMLYYGNYELDSQSLDALLFPSMAEKHKNAVNKEFSQYPLYFLRDSEDNLHIVQLEYSMDYYKQSTYLTMVFKKNDDGLPATVLLDEEGTILGVTNEFHRRTNMYNLKGKIFMKLFPGTDAILNDHYNLLKIHWNFKLFARFTVVDGEGYIIVSLISKEIEEISIAKASFNNVAECSKFNIEDMFSFFSDEPKEELVSDFYENKYFKKDSIQEKEHRRTKIDMKFQSCLSSSTADSTVTEATYMRRSRTIKTAFNKIFCSVAGIYILSLSFISAVLVFYWIDLNHVSMMLGYYSALSDSSCGIVMSGQLVRLVDLRSKGLVLSDEIDDDLYYYYLLLENSSVEISRMLEDSYSEVLKEVFREEDVSVWSLEGKEVVRRDKNLLQISEEFRQILLQVYENLDSDETLGLASMFFIYLNSHDEFIQKITEIGKAHREESTYFVGTFNVIRTINLILLLVLHILGGLVIACKLSTVQRISDNLWGLLVHMNESVIRAKIENMRERLERFNHEMENECMNAKKPTDKVQTKKVWVGILTVTIVNSFVSFASIVAIDVFFLEPYYNVNNATEELLNTVNSDNLNAALAWENTMEYYLLDSDLSIYETLKFHNPIINVEQSMVSHTEKINKFIDKTSELLKSSDLESLRHVQESYLGINDFYTDIYRLSYDKFMNMDDLRSFRSKETTQADIMSMYETSKELRSSQAFMISKTIDLIVEELNRQKFWAVFLLSSNIFLSIVYCLVFIRPVILKTKASIKVFSDFIRTNKIHGRRGV